MKSAAITTLAGSLVCYPRLALWSGRPYPIWYLEAVLLLGGFVLWAFVFAWHAEYTSQPVFTLKLPTTTFMLATLAGIIMAGLLHWKVDPAFRVRTPEDYPAELQEWIAMSLFNLGFTQLFLVFAPFDWCVRLARQRWIAVLFTVGFGVFVLVVKTRSSPEPLAPSLFWLLVVVRAATSFFSVWFYSRHGVILAWWWAFLLQSRHLVRLAGDPSATAE